MAHARIRARAPLLEREAEFAAIDAALAATAAGRGRLVLVEGPPGIGKSSLLAVMCDHAREAGLEVLRADCDEFESGFPFGLAIQLLEPALRQPGGGRNGNRHSPSRLFEGSATLAAELFGDVPAAGALVAADASFARIHGLTWLCANLSSRAPLLLCVDDAHWADELSLSWIGYLARRLEGLRVLLAVAARTGEPEAGEEALRRLRRAPDPLVLSPSPLSEGAVGELVRTGLGDAAPGGLAGACHRASGGNPFFVHELVAELAPLPPEEALGRAAELVPERVSRAVGERLARLPEDAVSLAVALAVLGEPAELRQAAEVAGLDADAAARAADALAAAGLAAQGLPPRFAHPLVRGSVYDATSAAERELLHRRAAEVLAGTGAAAERVAGHVLECEPAGGEWAIEPLRESARRALASGAPSAAARYLERAVAEQPVAAARTELLVELGQAQIEAGDPTSMEILEEATASDGTLDQALVVRELGRALAVFGRLEEAADAFDRASAAAGEIRRDLRLEIEAELASILLTLSGRAGVTERLARHRDGLEARSAGERMLMAVAAFADAQGNAPSGPSADLAAQALAGWREHGLRSASLCFYEGVLALMYADRYDEAERFLDEELADARARGSLTSVGNASWLGAWAHLRRGELADAEAEAAGTGDLLDEGAGASGPLVRGVLVEALVERGRLDEAEDALAGEAEGELPPVSIFNPLLYSRGLLRLARERAEEGLADVLAAGRRESSVGGTTPAVFPWRSTAAVALIGLGRSAAARPLAEEELELARAFGAPRALGIARRAAGLVAGGERGIGLLEEAVEVLEYSPARLEHARTLCELGAAMRRKGSRRRAREPLRRALDLARECGATPLAERAREELVASGARPRRAALTGRDALTPSELRVARMAAEGKSNRQVAQDLFVTVRTVEGHLSRAYAKLGIASREELPAALGGGAPG